MWCGEGQCGVVWLGVVWCVAWYGVVWGLGSVAWSGVEWSVVQLAAYYPITPPNLSAVSAVQCACACAS